MNFRNLESGEKAKLKPVVEAMKTVLYEDEIDSLDGLVINFGKGSEPRYTVRIEVIS